MPTFNYRYLLDWIRRNFGKLDELFILADELRIAVRDGVWPIIKQIGDLFAESDLPAAGGLRALAEHDTDHLEAEILAALAGNKLSVQAWDGSRLRKLFDTLLPVMTTLLPILLELQK